LNKKLINHNLWRKKDEAFQKKCMKEYERLQKERAEMMGEELIESNELRDNNE